MSDGEEIDKHKGVPDVTRIGKENASAVIAHGCTVRVSALIAHRAAVNLTSLIRQEKLRW